jgi:hypothetical protein
MTRWEYKTSPTLGTDLNALGQDGWELVCMDSTGMHFKRPIAEPAPAVETMESRFDAVAGQPGPAAVPATADPASA